VKPSGGQVRPLLSLRWAMVRSTGARVALIAVMVLGALLVASCAAGFLLAQQIAAFDPQLAEERRLGVTLLLPTAMLAFTIMSVVAPMAAGGAYELIPAEQLVAYPMRARTMVLLSAVLTPLNLAWFVQVLLLVFSASFGLVGPYAPWLPLLLTGAFIGAVTVAGQAIAWLVVGVRKSSIGRAVVWIAAATVVGLAVWIVRTGGVTDVLDELPTRKLLGAMLVSAGSGFEPVVIAWLLALVALIPLGLLVSSRVANWALRRPDDRGGALSGRTVSRRAEPRAQGDRSVYSLLLAMDRASVWRSAPLRRGVLVLAILPGAVAALAGMPWDTVAVMPPLVASGAGLLFGVNAFSLDGSGALWVASTPHNHRLVLRSKMRVIAEVGAVAVAIAITGAVIGGAARGREFPSALDLLIVLACSISCVLLVAAICLRLSVTRPHRAELKEARDTPAPPGVMAVYSTVLALITTPLGLLYCGATLLNSAMSAALLTAGTLLATAALQSGTSRRWDSPLIRSGVVSTVASG